MKRCELCKGKARMHCESDQASLCWDCDAKVHSANFLVARHLRILLCHVCQSRTPWTASGTKLGPAFSFCEQCEEVVEDNQVVPWSPPPAESSSSSEESVSCGDVVVSRKRCGFEDASSNIQSEDDEGCSSSQPKKGPPSKEQARMANSISRRKTTPLRKFRKTEPGRADVCGSGILDSNRRLHQEETGPGEETLEFCTFPEPSI
ncbi:hypothetical protein CDL12_23149 [Handroanthus impetiginosus]|uniref:B box-type domain-containing protein n=1 Tax=Handroanthus impetiginosus TaxID=429701 RepID=A0A2G9GGA4_9LAMI|nr:hypothetical protein CDL12_23149 [Handroanthus impetiginosus]